MPEANIDKKSNKFFSSLLVKNYFFCFFIIALSFFLDRISKIKIIEHQLTNDTIYVNDFINIDLVWNTGIGFGLLSSNSSIFYNSILCGGGDASQLSDIVRATLEFKMHPDVLEDMYGAVEYMVYASELNGCRVSVTLFHDRYQHPFKGGYKDLLCLIQVNGFVCELQLNIDEMLKIKEGAGHTQYEKIRKVTQCF